MGREYIEEEKGRNGKGIYRGGERKEREGNSRGKGGKER